MHRDDFRNLRVFGPIKILLLSSRIDIIYLWIFNWLQPTKGIPVERRWSKSNAIIHAQNWIFIPKCGNYCITQLNSSSSSIGKNLNFDFFSWNPCQFLVISSSPSPLTITDEHTLNDTHSWYFEKFYENTWKGPDFSVCVSYLQDFWKKSYRGTWRAHLWILHRVTFHKLRTLTI